MLSGRAFHVPRKRTRCFCDPGVVYEIFIQFKQVLLSMKVKSPGHKQILVYLEPENEYDSCNRRPLSVKRNLTRSSATAKSTARPSCLVGVLYDISQEKICGRLTNHFSVIGHGSYRIRRYDSIQTTQPLRRSWSFKVTDFLCQSNAQYDFLLVINTNLRNILHRFQVMADYWSNFRYRHGSASL